MGRPRGDSRERLLRGAFEAVRDRGYAGASSRVIAEIAGVNPALVFYYFGTVDDLLVAALAESSESRLDRYREPIVRAASPAQLFETLGRIYREDVASGHVRVVSELVGASVSRPDLAARVTALMEPWLELAEQAVATSLAGTPLEGVAPPRQIAFAAIVFYLGANLLTHLVPDEAEIHGLLRDAARVASLFEAIGGAP
jgi:AcrR family transcriptional regulator